MSGRSHTHFGLAASCAVCGIAACFFYFAFCGVECAVMSRLDKTRTLSVRDPNLLHAMGEQLESAYGLVSKKDEELRCVLFARLAFAFVLFGQTFVWAHVRLARRSLASNA